MTKLYFITGTDTGVGKTVASIALLQSARQIGYTTAAYKPVSTGNTVLHNEALRKEEIENSDVLMLQKNSTLILSYREINPYNFKEATSVHIVSFNENRPIDFTVISNGLDNLKHKADWITIEGVGGWLSPLSKRKTLADWVVLEQLPVIMVVDIKIGCINHAVLTSRAVIRSGVRLVGWIANNTQQPGRRHTEYIASLSFFLQVPLIGEIPWLGKNIDHSNVGKYIDINKLNSSFL